MVCGLTGHKMYSCLATINSLLQNQQLGTCVAGEKLYPHLYNPCVAYPCGLRMEREAALITVK